MVVFKCCECMNYYTVYRENLNNNSELLFYTSINYCIYCYKCIQKCYHCSNYIIKKNNKEYCSHCENIMKIKLIKHTSNIINNKLPNELIGMILQYL